MKRLTNGLLAAVLALAFLARGAAAYCPPKAASHDCCDKPAPSAPQTPCPEMACCQVAPATAAPAAGPAHDLIAQVPVVGVKAASSSPSFVVPASSDSGPPGPRAKSVSDRSPPSLHG